MVEMFVMLMLWFLFFQDELGGVKISEADRQRLKLKSAARKGQGSIQIPRKEF